MEIQNYLTKRNNVYHFKRRVPKNLVSTLGKKEIISLNEIQVKRNMVQMSEKEDFKYSSVTNYKETKEYKARLNKHNEWLKEYIY